MIDAFNIYYYNYFVLLFLILLFFRYESSGIPAKVNHPHYLITAKGQTSDLTLHCEEKPTNFRKPTDEEGVWFKETGKVSLK